MLVTDNLYLLLCTHPLTPEDSRVFKARRRLTPQAWEAKMSPFVFEAQSLANRAHGTQAASLFLDNKYTGSPIGRHVIPIKERSELPFYLCLIWEAQATRDITHPDVKSPFYHWKRWVLRSCILFLSVCKNGLLLLLLLFKDEVLSWLICPLRRIGPSVVLKVDLEMTSPNQESIFLLTVLREQDRRR